MRGFLLRGQGLNLVCEIMRTVSLSFLRCRTMSSPNFNRGLAYSLYGFPDRFFMSESFLGVVVSFHKLRI